MVKARYSPKAIQFEFIANLRRRSKGNSSRIVGARFIGRWRHRTGRIARHSRAPTTTTIAQFVGANRIRELWEPDSSGDGGTGQAASPGKPGSHNTYTAWPGSYISTYTARQSLAPTTPTLPGKPGSHKNTFASAFRGSPIHRAMAAAERPHRPASLAPTTSSLPGIAWLSQKHLRFCLSWEPDSSGDGGGGEAASPGKPGSHGGQQHFRECDWLLHAN